MWSFFTTPIQITFIPSSTHFLLTSSFGVTLRPTAPLKVFFWTYSFVQTQEVTLLIKLSHPIRTSSGQLRLPNAPQLYLRFSLLNRPHFLLSPTNIFLILGYPPQPMQQRPLPHYSLLWLHSAPRKRNSPLPGSFRKEAGINLILSPLTLPPTPPLL